MKEYIVFYTNGTREVISADSLFDKSFINEVKRSCEFSETAVKQIILL